MLKIFKEMLRVSLSTKFGCNSAVHLRVMAVYVIKATPKRIWQRIAGKEYRLSKNNMEVFQYHAYKLWRTILKS